MHPSPPPRWTRPTVIAATLGGYAVAGGLATLLGWALNVPRLTDWENSGVSQMPNNALGVASAGAAIILATFGWRRASLCLAALAALIGGATLFQHLTGADLGIDTLLLFHSWGQRGTVTPGRMGPPGATTLMLIGVSIVLSHFPRTRRFAPAGGLLTLSIAALSLIGYFFGADRLYTIPKLTTIARQTSTMVFALGVALVAAVPERQPMRLLIGRSAGSLLVRRALPVIIVLPLVLGWLRLRGQELGLFDTAFAMSMLVLVLIAMFTVLLWWAASSVEAHETELRASERKFSLMFQKATFGAALTTLPEGVIVDVNEAFTQQLGFSKSEVIGKQAEDLGITIDETMREQLLQQLREHGFARGVELPLRVKGGEERVFFHSSIVVELGGRQHALTTIQDITERKRAEESLRASAEALREADRMKDQFLATLSHELRTPLTAIIGWAHMLLDGTLDPGDQRAAYEAIRASAKAQAQLVEDVLDVSRVATGKMRLEQELTDLATLIENAVAVVRPAAEARRMPLRLKLDRTLPHHFIDPARMQQVLWNLLSNAIKFSPDGAPVDVVLRSEDSHAVIEVIDRGPGIPALFRPHLFERFRQADSSSSRTFGGLGIGLALAKELVELHGGRIDVDSEEERGSRFTIRLPSPVYQKPAAPATTAPRGDVLLAGVRVLYVDDREDARRVIAMMLKNHGAEVLQAASVDDALALLDLTRPHIVLTDIAMPSRDGYDLLAAIRAERKWSDLPVLALTAERRADDEERAVAAGFQALLRKPIEPKDLAAAVARAAPPRG